MVCWCIIISQNVKKIGLLLSRSRSRPWVKMSMFVQTISSELANICHQTWYDDASSGAEFHAKRLVYYLQDQGHREGPYNKNMTVSTVSSEPPILLRSNVIWWYIVISKSVLWKFWLLFSRSRSQRNFKMLMNIRLDDIFLIAEPVITTLCMMMHHHELECHVKRLVCRLWDQGHSEGEYNIGACNVIWFFPIVSLTSSFVSFFLSSTSNSIRNCNVIYISVCITGKDYLSFHHFLRV